MRWSYDNIKSTGLFDKDCERWRKRPAMLKTWQTFKTFFITAEDDRKKNNLTANDATHTANQVQQIINDEITRSSSSDRSASSVQVAQAFVDGTSVSYCWSQGITRNLQHSSQTCSRPKEGHQRDVTYHDR